MKKPTLNVEEKIDGVADGAATSNKSPALTSEKAKGGLRIPRGVYRFKTHEEADEWMAQMLARSGENGAKKP